MSVASQLQITFGERVRDRRKELEWSQADLAAKVNVKQPVIADIEKGHHSPTLETVEKIAKALKIKPSELI